MRQYSGMWLGWCLSSVGMITLSLITATPGATATPWAQRMTLTESKTSVSPHYTIAQGGTVGGPLAKQLQGKPVVVDIYASWCPACRNVAPTLAQLKKQYSGKAHFVMLDVSDRVKTNQSELKAKQLGLDQFFRANKAQTGLIAIIDPATGKILVQNRNNANSSAYTTVLNAAISPKMMR